MHVIITGATGNLGTATVRRLRAGTADVTVDALSRRVPAADPPPGVRWRQVDVRTDPLVERFRGADAVVHLAWRFQPTRDPVSTWRTNVLGSLRVFEAAAAAGVGCLVHLSSVGAYTPGPPGDAPVDETWPTHALPTAAYGQQKSYLERALDAWEQRAPELRVVRLRPAFVFQRAAASEQRRLFAGPFLPHPLVRPRWVPVVPDVPGLSFQVVHADDVAAAIVSVIHGDARGAFNLAADPPLTTADVAELLGARTVRVSPSVLRRATGVLWRAHLIPASPGLVALVTSLPLLDTARARRELGWSPSKGAHATLAGHLEAIAAGAAGPTPPLAPRAGGAARWQELTSGVGARDPVP